MTKGFSHQLLFGYLVCKYFISHHADSGKPILTSLRVLAKGLKLEGQCDELFVDILLHMFFIIRL
jgi:hypothetical protein